MTVTVRPMRRWSVALAAALAAHGLIAAWLWPRAAQRDAAGAAAAAILIELPAPSAPPHASTTSPTSVPAPPATSVRPAEPRPLRQPPPAPQPSRAPRVIERPMQPDAVDATTAPVAADAASATSAPDEADAAATSAEEPGSDSEPDPESGSTAAASALSAATTTAPQRGSTQGRPAAEIAWQSRLLGHLEGFRRYPTRALRQRHEGVTYLRFSVDRRGGVGAVRLERGSGSDLLDAEALEVVRRAQPVPAPPPEIEGDPIEVVVPVQFRLRRR